jgi:hypothetical protein
MKLGRANLLVAENVANMAASVVPDTSSLRWLQMNYCRKVSGFTILLPLPAYHLR